MKKKLHFSLMIGALCIIMYHVPIADAKANNLKSRQLAEIPMAEAQYGVTLAEALDKLKAYYKADILFADRMIQNITVEMESIDWEGGLEKNLDKLLSPNQLSFIKQRGGSYVIIAKNRQSGTGTPVLSQLVTQNNGLVPIEPNGSNGISENLPFGDVAQRVRGKVVSELDGLGLPGVTVLLKGTAIGTVTDQNGDYVLEFEDENAILVFSFIGFETQEVAVGNREIVDITMQEDMKSLQEAVVTALGVKREKQSLGYSVGNVEGRDLTETPQNNVLNAMAGKVAGVQISQMDGTAGSSVNIIIRGANSLNNDNQPLFVIDGVPVANKLNNGFGGADMGNPISDINPNDIENVSILKGPSAAALYGSRAGNGVVLITTKSGSGRKGFGVAVNSSVVMDFPFKYIPIQNEFASGKSGAHVFEESQNESWGPELDVGEEWVQWNSNGKPAPLVSYPDRFKDFFRTGYTNTNNVAINGDYDKGSFRLSVGNMTNTGIIPNTDFSRLTIGLNTSYNITDRLRATATINITESGSDNRPIIDGGRTSPVRSLYETGAQVNILDLQQYWVPGSEGILQRKYKQKQNNPYFVVNENPTGFDRNRTVSKLQLDYDVTNDLSLMLRYARDSYDEQQEAIIAYNNYDQINGGYHLRNNINKENNLDFMLNYQKIFNEDWNITALAGVNRMEQKYGFMDNNAGQLVIPMLYTISNGAPGTVSYDSQQFWKVIYGVYGSVSTGFQDKLYLDITARNDWSSTLPIENRSYFYPSASLSAIVSEMIDMPSFVDLFKFRAGIAQVGNDVAPYSLIPTFNTALDWGTAKSMYMGGLLRNTSLKPEISTSSEAGFDISLFNNRLGIDATYYVRGNKNQVLPIDLPIESGASSKLINAGLVQSRGFELGLSTSPIVSGDFRWDMNVNLTRNRTSIKELADGITYYNFTSYSGAELRTYVGGDIGDIYMRPVLTVKDTESPYYGYPVLTGSGLYQADQDVNNLVKIGNFNHDLMISFQPTFTYKNLSFYANIDWRQGGEFYSNTMMFLGNNGMLEETLSGMPYDPNRPIEDQIKENPEAYFGNWIGGRNAAYKGLPWTGEEATYREQDASFNVGVRESRDVDGNIVYIENLGGPTTQWLNPFQAYRYANRPFPDRNLYSATYVKLREIAFTYRLPTDLLDKISLRNASISVVGNNLFVWTEAGNGIDPERAFRQTGNRWIQGVEYYNVMPWTGSLGLKVNAEF
jgi:TonB-linked SusC/RagA family outer membrane protein